MCFHLLKFCLIVLNTALVFLSTGLTLQEDVYYVILCAVNSAGLRKCTSSDGVLIDPTPPNKGVVHDGILEPDLRFQSLTTSIAANWEGIWDLESQITNFEWAVGTSASDKTSVQSFTDVGLSTHVKSLNPMSLRSGQTYFVHLRITNQAGIVRELVSDGVTVDNSPPIPSIILPGFDSNSDWHYSTSTKTFYNPLSNQLAAYWDPFVEPESELWYYKWALGTTRCGTQVQPLVNIGRVNRANTTSSDINFVVGVRYYVTVIAKNRAGLLSRACSDAFVFDRSAPQAGRVYIGQNLEKSREYVSKEVLVSWTGFKDSQSGIAQCQVVVRREDGIVAYNSSRDTAEGVVSLSDNPLLVPGLRYHASVTCLNNAGLQSSASAPAFLIDSTPPRLDGSIITGESRDVSGQYQADTKTLTVTWAPFTDDESPVVRYELQIGSNPLSGDILPFYDLQVLILLAPFHLSVCKFSLHFPHKISCLVMRIKQMIIHSNLSEMKNKILQTCLQGYNRNSLGEVNNNSYGIFGADRVKEKMNTYMQCTKKS